MQIRPAFRASRWMPPVLLVLFMLPHLVRGAEPLTLAGEWRFALDRADVGVKEAWFNRNLTDRIQLPGVLQAQGYGDEISTNTPWVLSLYDKNWFQRADYTNYTQPGHVKVPFVCQPPRHYLGAAWYQRDIEIPTNWAGRRVVLFLERTRWETRAWLDDRPLGTNNSLCVPHEFEAGVVGTESNQIKPGKHRLTVRCDNRMLMAYRPDAHAVSDSLNSTWNGIVGKMELRSTALVWIENAQIFQGELGKPAKLKLVIGNATGIDGSGSLHILYNHCYDLGKKLAAGLPQQLLEIPIQWNAGATSVEIECKLPELNPWSEFSPAVHQLHLALSSGSSSDSRSIKFALRDFKAVGQEFFINGRPTHLRGTHHGGDFALTGYPPCDVEYWLKLFRTCKEWGLNHVRFHSFCPPEAAFTAADEVGIYLQIEPGMWNDISPGTPMEAMLYAETERILKAYGNHPSFVLLSASNEAKGRWKEALPKWVKHFREVDPRRLYTPDTGWSLIDEPGPVDGADFLAVHRIGQNLMRGERGWFGRDYARATRGVNVPIVTHEVGQWCAYPDYDVIRKFAGYMRPRNFEIFRDSAEKHGLLGRAGSPLPAAGSTANDGAHGATRPTTKDFAQASGRFQLACYKEEIEANLRTPGLAGVQLLDLHDYVGQGTALVGVLDPFWESKGYVEAAEWRQFCSPVVPLARLSKRVFTTADKLEVPVEVANYSAAAKTNAGVAWEITDSKGLAVARGECPVQTLAVGRAAAIGTSKADLAKLGGPGHYKLTIRVAADVRRRSSIEREDIRLLTSAATNSWNFWLYPAQIDSSVPTNVLLTSLWDEAEAKLAAGGRVVFQPPLANLDWSSPPLDKLPVFWNRLMGPGWSRMLGLWCDTNHPALAGFPTEVNCDWQWTEIIKTRAINLDKLPRELSPIVSAIDDWNRNWKLGLIFEARVGQGRLLVTSFDLSADSPVAKQLRRSLLDYAAGDKFQPKTKLAAAAVRGLWFDNFVMRKLGTQAVADAGDAGAAIDGDPNTFWIAGAPARGTRTKSHPHELRFTFAAPVAMNGLIFMNRQNDRDHLGDIRQYAVSVSNDGERWHEVLRGDLASTWVPQIIQFPTTVTAHHLKLVAGSGYGGDASAALAELAVIYAGPKLPDNLPGPLELKRVRSTSSDIDEGGAMPASVPTNSGSRR
jgi:beta-galactosidase